MEILGLLDIPLWLILLPGFLLLLYVYGTWNHSLWSSQGIPGPKPSPLIGNLREIRQKGHFRIHSEWKEQYGRIVGFFSGVRPQMSITDLDMVREVMVKNFNNFTDRNLIKGMRRPIMDKALFFAGGSTWKRIRTMMTPTFSTSKLKLMSRFVHRCTELLVSSIEKKAKAGQLIDVKEVFGAFTMDVIAGTGFGLETNSQTQEGEPFVQHCKTLFSRAGFKGLMGLVLYFGSAFPFLGPFLGKLGSNNSQFFFSAVEKMVDERRADNTVQSKKSPDLLQMLVDAEADPETISDQADNSDDAKSNRRLTKEEIMAQGWIVLIAGYETTATTLQYLTYNLSIRPDIQQRIFEEIRDELDGADPTYDNVSQLKYLEAAVRETLRMFPPAAIVSRKSLLPTTINGINIPADCGIMIPIYTILHDPEYFPDPEVFNPERFMDENLSKIHPVTSDLFFGYGPRKCIGMRLAMLEIKFAAAKMLQRFRFVKGPETPEKIVLSRAAALSVPDTVIKLKAKIRSD